MIRENITVTIGNDSFSGELTAPSVVMTSKPQQEVLDLTKTPNFVLKVEDTNGSLNVTDVVEVAFIAGDKSYTANAKVYNKTGKYVALQYMDGLTAEDAPEPETHTLAFKSNEYNCSYDTYTKESTPSNSVIVEYDGNPIIVDGTMLDGCTHCRYEQQLGGTGVFLADGSEVGGYEDVVTCTYEGITATTTVIVSITDSTPETHTLAFDNAEYDLQFDIYGGGGDPVDFYVTYDGEPVAFEDLTLSQLSVATIGQGSSSELGALEPAYKGDVGEYTETLTATYEGLTATCTVVLTVIDTQIHTLEFDSANYNTSYDIYTGEKSQARVNVLYDGASIHLTTSMFSGLVYNKIEPIVSAGGIFKAKDALPEVSAGATYVDNVTVTYEGLTASCTITLTVTDSEPAPEPQEDYSQQISDILGSDYEVINDMTEQDALDAANNILYGEQS